MIYILLIFIKYHLGIGDWGLGIGPNPQSPIPNPLFKLNILLYYNKNNNKS